MPTATDNVYKNLVSQADKLRRHNRQGSYKTKERYFEGMKRFCRFLAETYHLEKLSNISPKHIRAYVDAMKEKALSASTIKTELSAIRFYHDQMPNPRHRLPDNNSLSTERRSYGEKDRTWSDEEFAKMVEIAEQTGHKDYAAIFYLARYAGLRVHECFRIDTATARNAVKNMAITIKGKGGKVRTVHLTQTVCDKLSEMLAVTQQGHKLFVPDDMPTDAAITRLQQFIIKHREKVRDGDADVQITAHGLRHCYAADTYGRLLSEGKSQREAKQATSKLLGHNRPEVTNIYISSLKGGDGDI